MDTKDKILEFHIIHSMKGGCGKTAFSLFKALDLAQRNIEGGKADVLYIDADFKGSALEWLIYESKSVLGESMEELLKKAEGRTPMKRCQLAFSANYSKKNLNHYINGACDTLDSILAKGICYNRIQKAETHGGGEEINLNGYIDFIFASSNLEDKHCLCYNDVHGHHKMPSLGAGKYTYKMENLIRQIINYRKNSKKGIGQYRHIIIDMPPGYDEYADLLLVELRRFAQKEERIKLNYYGVTTNDRGHLHTLYQNIKTAVSISEQYKTYNSVNVVLNCQSSEDFKEDAELQNVKKELQDVVSSEEKMPAIVINEYQEEYRKFCRQKDIHDFTYSFKNISIN